MSGFARLLANLNSCVSALFGMFIAEAAIHNRHGEACLLLALWACGAIAIWVILKMEGDKKEGIA